MIVNILFVILKRRNGVNPLFFPKKGCILMAGDIPFFENSHGDGHPWRSDQFSIPVRIFLLITFPF
jgi:hypothetical protein